jgi:NADPH-dependent glutamate synthase beta subunit-like oxidoreductase
MFQVRVHGPGVSTMRKPFAITLDVGSSRANRTGAWRTGRPLYVHNLPPCNNACPAGENIQQWLYHAEDGGPERYEAAWRQIMDDNPFPAIMGRVCYRPCETACNRAQLDSAVGINSAERFLGDEALRRGWRTPVDAAPTGKRVLVVGAGPSGLSAAYHLTRLGHAVTVKDAGAEPGGMMRYGIPKYRLPCDILDAEVNRILDIGVTLELNAEVTDIQAELARGFDAACGTAATPCRTSTRSPGSAASTPGTTPTPRPPCGPRWRPPGRSPRSTRW